MIVKIYKYFFEILLLQSGLQIKYSLVKSKHSHLYKNYAKWKMTKTGTIFIKNHVLEVPLFHAKMRLKSALQKEVFLLTKSIQKSYTLNCSHKCPCTFPHSHAVLRCLFFKKNHLMWNQQHFQQPREPKIR